MSEKLGMKRTTINTSLKKLFIPLFVGLLSFNLHARVTMGSCNEEPTPMECAGYSEKMFVQCTPEREEKLKNICSKYTVGAFGSLKPVQGCDQPPTVDLCDAYKANKSLACGEEFSNSLKLLCEKTNSSTMANQPSSCRTQVMEEDCAHYIQTGSIPFLKGCTLTERENLISLCKDQIPTVGACNDYNRGIRAKCLNCNVKEEKYCKYYPTQNSDEFKADCSFVTEKQCQQYRQTGEMTFSKSCTEKAFKDHCANKEAIFTQLPHSSEQQIRQPSARQNSSQQKIEKKEQKKPTQAVLNLNLPETSAEVSVTSSNEAISTELPHSLDEEKEDQEVIQNHLAFLAELQKPLIPEVCAQGPDIAQCKPLESGVYPKCPAIYIEKLKKLCASTEEVVVLDMDLNNQQIHNTSNIFIVDESIQDEEESVEDPITLCQHEAFLKEYDNLFSTSESINLAGDISNVIDVNFEDLAEKVTKSEHNQVTHEQLISELFAKLEAGTLSKEAKEAIISMMAAIETSNGDLAQVNLDLDTKNLPEEIATDLKLINQLKIDALLGSMQPDTMKSLFIMDQVLKEEKKSPSILQSADVKALLRSEQTKMTIAAGFEKLERSLEEKKRNELETTKTLKQIAEGQTEIQKIIKDPEAVEKQQKREGFFKNIYSVAKDKFIKASHYTKEKFAQLAQFSKEKFSKAKDFSKEKWAKISEKTAPIFKKTKQQARELYEKTKENVSLLINSGKSKIHSLQGKNKEATEISSVLEKPAVFKNKKEAQIHALTSPEKTAYYVKDKKVYSVNEDAKVKRILKPMLSIQTIVKEKQAEFIMKKVTNEEAKNIYADLKSYKQTLSEKYKNDTTNPDYLIELHRLNKFYSLAVDSLKTAKKEGKE